MGSQNWQTNKLCSKASTQLQETCGNGRKLDKVISLEKFSLVIVMHLKIEMT
jgi:hypothetical protein